MLKISNNSLNGIVSGQKCGGKSEQEIKDARK